MYRRTVDRADRVGTRAGPIDRVGGRHSRRPQGETREGTPSAVERRRELPLDRRVLRHGFFGTDLVFQGLAGLVAPSNRGARNVALVAHGEKPEGELGRTVELVPQRRLEIGARLQVLKVMITVQVDLRERLLDAADLAQRQSQECFVTGNLNLRRLGKPFVEKLEPLLGDRVNLSVGFAALPLRFADRETLSRELFEDRVDLPIALAPEVRQKPTNELLDVVSGAWPECEETKNCEFAFVGFQGSTPPFSTVTEM